MGLENSEAMIKRTGLLFDNALAELDKLGMGDTLSKIAIISGNLMRRHVSLVSFSGVNKSVLLNNGHRFVSDVNEDDIAKIPGSTEVNGKLLFGTKQVKSNGEVIETPGIISESTMIVTSPEHSRVNPYGSNELNEFLENSTFAKYGDNTQIFNSVFRSFMMAYNPTDSGDGIFVLSDALKSRISLTAFTSGDLDFEQRKAIRKGWKAKPEEMKKIVTTEELDEIAKYVKEDYVLSDDNNIKIDDLEQKGKDFLRSEFGYREGPRLTSQLADVSKLLLVANDGKWDKFRLTPTAEESVGIVALRLVFSSRFAQFSTSRSGNTLDGLMEEFISGIK